MNGHERGSGSIHTRSIVNLHRSLEWHRGGESFDYKAYEMQKNERALLKHKVLDLITLDGVKISQLEQQLNEASPSEIKVIVSNLLTQNLITIQFDPTSGKYDGSTIVKFNEA